MPHSNIADRRRTLQAEESRLSSALSAVRSELNELVPISSLPVDIVEEIFVICVSWLYGNTKPLHRLAWSQVCRSWRRISTESPRLWRCIDLGDSQLAREFLTRSKTAPLTIISASPSKQSRFSEDLHPHAQRLQSIDVLLYPDDMVDLFSKIGPNLSNLTDLTLKIPPVSASLKFDIPMSTVQRLELDAVAVSWECCGGLTHLSLRGLISSFSPTSSQLRGILSRSPALESLRLENINPAITYDTDPGPIKLHRLRELSVSASIMTSILGDIIIPSNTHIRIYCSQFKDLTDLVGQNPTLWESATSTTIMPTMRLTREAFRLTPSSDLGAPNLNDSSLSVAFSSGLTMPIITALSSVLDLSRVTTLELDTTSLLHEILTTSLETLLTSTSNLECLRLSAENIKAALNALTPSSPSPSDIICPRLTTLSFGRPGVLWRQFKNRWWQSILSWANIRHSTKHPVKVLEFCQCQGIDQRILREIPKDLKDLEVVVSGDV